MKIIVLGAGLAGVTSAWYLAQAGHQVTVLERNPLAAEETSFANGGQISVSHPEPWANPGAPWQVLRWLGRDDAPLLFRLRYDPQQWKFALRFLGECRPARTRRNTEAVANLAVYSRARLQELRRSTGIAYDCLERGILHVFFASRAYRHAVKKAEHLLGYGIDLRPCPADECRVLEPALAGAQRQLAGGLYARDDESGDARLFVLGLVDLCRKAGVEFHFGTRIEKLEVFGKRIAGVHVRESHGRGRINGDAFVLAAGSFSPKLARTVGESLPIYPVKGYSATIALPEGVIAPHVSITDESHRIVMSRLGNRLRIAGTAELAGFDRSINPARCQAILRQARELFPDAIPPDVKAEYWAGLRPATPSNVPIIGKSRYENLFFNTGHGTLGWTLSCGSASALADIVDGRRPEVDFPFCGLPEGDG
ncbi:MAG: D-amino acid dehydrogenase [Rhodocyclaceae bacterium]|nr:D-amino acid dehydrogenase [Rhodocyclaceae bacterium]